MWSSGTRLTQEPAGPLDLSHLESRKLDAEWFQRYALLPKVMLRYNGPGRYTLSCDSEGGGIPSITSCFFACGESVQRVVGNVIEMKVSEGLEAFDGGLKSGVDDRLRQLNIGPSFAVVEALRKL